MNNKKTISVLENKMHILCSKLKDIKHKIRKLNRTRKLQTENELDVDKNISTKLQSYYKKLLKQKLNIEDELYKISTEYAGKWKDRKKRTANTMIKLVDLITPPIDIK